MTVVFTDLEELRAALGKSLGPTAWLPVTQERITAFADATDDHQWIHVEPDRAANGPFGDPDRPRLPHVVTDPAVRRSSSDWNSAAPGVNYGVNKVRFLSVRADSEPDVRPLRATLSGVAETDLITDAKRLPGGLRVVSSPCQVQDAR